MLLTKKVVDLFTMKKCYRGRERTGTTNNYFAITRYLWSALVQG